MKPRATVEPILAPMQHIAAERFGRMLAAGLLSYSEILGSLMQAALPHIPDEDFERRVLEVEHALGTTLANAADAVGLAASRAIRAAILPLIVRRTPRDAILAVAHQASRGRISPASVEAVAKEEVAAALAQMRLAPRGERPAARQRAVRHAR